MGTDHPPQYSPSADGTALPFAYLLRQAAAANRLRLDRAMADVGVTAPQFLVLRLIAENRGCTNAALARMMAVTTPTVTVIVNNLKRADAVTARTSPDHGRVQNLDLTDSGRHLLAACFERVRAVEAELEAQLTVDQLAVIRSWLCAMIDDAPKGYQPLSGREIMPG